VRRYLYPRADVVVTLTERGADFLRSEGLSNIEVIPNPVPPPPHNEEVKALEPRIIAIGRLAREKRFDLLIEAFAMIAPSFPDWTLSIYGEGPLRERLEWEISRRHLAGQVELRGGLDSPYAALSSRPVFALTSDVEGFPVALSEAMASGCAVVATDCPTGPRELIAHGENGLLVRPRDAAALAGAFQAIFSSEILRRKLGEGARLITARYPPDMIFGRWWDEISAPPRARP
jgi:glycosyltransferase involved in cell wall biosynthesis